MGNLYILSTSEIKILPSGYLYYIITLDAVQYSILLIFLSYFAFWGDIMEKVVYERHSYRHYKSKTLPFIFHTDVLSGFEKFSSSLHWHENIEFLCCVSGSGEATTQANVYSFNEGDVITINSNSPHSFSNIPEKQIVYNCLIVDSGFCKENGINVEGLTFNCKTVDKTATKLYLEAFNACSNECEFHSLLARTKVLQFILYMCQNHLVSNENNTSISSMEAIKKSVSFIRNNYSESITLNDAADVAGFSVYYFSREFKKVTGQTFVTFLNTVRCERAARMLREGTNVTNACFACGFKELGYFSRTFSRIMGCPPSQINQSE